ncbi:MAG: helix-turn-helix transcriptional regulator [Kiritimatiellae bacterium]|nr:helix-turn-helix transcriptional regulator [Kiritimatiellia bacterium]
MNTFIEDVLVSTDFWTTGVRRHYCDESWQWENRTLDDYDIWHVADGAGEIRINDGTWPMRRGMLFIFAPDDVVTAAQDLSHRLVVDYCHFSAGGKTTLFNACLRLPSAFGAEDGVVPRLFERALADEERGPARKLARKVFLLRLLRYLLEKGAIGMRADTSAGNSSYRMLRRLTEFAEQNLSRRILLADLAQAVASNRTTVTRLFKTYLRQTPHQYVSRLKIERAREMLARGTPAKEAADRLGFSDVYAFSKLFKKIEKVTPGQFVRGLSVQG